ncbi:MAG TPA: hypothetical protein VMF66_07900 [Candidatus Acidoferrum sp.]|nr:hypothetical protein [Candidatus Acidoferrum sp.]
MKEIDHARMLQNQPSTLPDVNRGNPKQSWAGRMLVIIALVSAVSRCAAGASFTPYQTASATQTQGNVTIRHGILILAVPTLVLFALIVAIVYKRRNVSR